MGAGILDSLANYNPTGFAQQNQLRQQQVQYQPQILQGEIEKQGLENQLTRQAIQDQQALRSAYGAVDWSKPTADQDFEKAAMQNGASYNAILTQRSNLMNLRKSAADIAKMDAETGSKNLENERSINTMTGQALQPYNDVVSDPNSTPEQIAQAWAQAFPTLNRLHRDLFPAGMAPPDPQHTAGMIGTLGLHEQVLKDAETKAGIAQKQQETAASQQTARLAQEAAQREQYAREHPDDPAAQRNAMTASQAAETNIKQQTLQKELAQLQEQMRHNLSEESSRKLMAEISAGRLAMEQTVNGLKYGPGTQEYWIKQLQDNPDSIKEMPPELRSAVGKGFTAATGLPLPSPVSATNQTSETAARNALDNITKIRELVKDPEVQSRLGPILGRLGNAEQAAGTAVGLSPAAEAKAQQLRTLMRYFVFQEGKALLSGRMPQQLMHELEQNSAAPKMDANTLAGALSGSEESAKTILDNVDRQRFGGKMRSRAQRGLQNYAITATGPGGHKIGSNDNGQTWFDVQNGQEVK